MSTAQIVEQSSPAQSRSWLAPSLALAFAALFVAAFAASDPGAEPETSGADVIANHAVSDGAQFATGTALIIAAIVLVFFGGWLRQMLRSKSSDSGWLPDVAFAGTILQSLTLSIFVSSARAVQDGIASGDPVIARTLSITDGNNFVTAMLGLSCILIATGVSAYQSGALPRWLAVVSVVLGVMAPLGPAGFAPFLSFPIWVVVVAFVATSTKRQGLHEVTTRATTVAVA